MNVIQDEALNAGRATAALECAWGVIANTSGGDWTQQTPEWREAAQRWRDEHWHTWLDSLHEEKT